MTPKERTFYELIRPNTPCMFYLDLEYSKTLNPDINGDAMMSILRVEAKKLFLDKLGIDLQSYTPIWSPDATSLQGRMIELDASNDNKFSRHFHIILDSLCLFRNVRHVKEFATSLHNTLWQNNHRVTKVIGNEMCQTTFIDLNVYNNNQNFRLILSSKFAEKGERPLNLYVPEIGSTILEDELTYDMFRQTLLACNGLKNINLLGWPSIKPCNKRRRYNEPLNHVAAAEPVPQVLQPERGHRRILNHHHPQSIKLATTQYPKLHQYFATQILPNWPQLLDPALPPAPCTGKITLIEYSRYSGNFVYVKITGNRFCHAVQRKHRSNNIYFLVEVPEFLFRQGCYDVSCNGVLSQAFPIPPEIFF